MVTPASSFKRVQAKSRGGKANWTLTKKLDCCLSFAGPGEIKRREVSWTLTKKLRLSFAGPGEIKRREVVLDPQESPGVIKSRD